jgi:manganese/iron transport system ATP-binding protein
MIRLGIPHLHDRDAPAIAARGVTVRYDGTLALDEVTFTLARGERVAVVGPNGAGKSTLFKVIAGLIRPTQGAVHLFGGAPEQHICVGYVPQRREIDARFPVNVYDVVMMGRVGSLGILRWPDRADRALALEALALVGMGEQAQRQIGELSGGQQQRVFIARALAQQAEIMLMDEPLNGLDTGSQAEIFRILDTLRARGVTVLVATHDLNQAAQCFDQVMLLSRRLVGLGLPTEVFTSERLDAAYGEQLRLVATGGGALAFSDAACHGGHE